MIFVKKLNLKYNFTVYKHLPLIWNMQLVFDASLHSW